MLNKKGINSRRISKSLLRIIGINVLLVVLLNSCNYPGSVPKASNQPEIMWSKTESPLFPTNWPPTSETVWVRYTFAYGRNISNLSDGNYVTNPLSKTEWGAGGTSTTKILKNDMTQAAVQGVLPLDSQTRLILEKESQVSAYCLKISGMPNPNTTETKEMVAYYQAWFKYNGAFLDMVRDQHADFIGWIEQNK